MFFSQHAHSLCVIFSRQTKRNDTTSTRFRRQHGQARHTLECLIRIAIKSRDMCIEPFIANNLFEPVENRPLPSHRRCLSATNLKALCALFQLPFDSLFVLHRPVSYMHWSHIMKRFSTHIQRTCTVGTAQPLLHRYSVE